MKIAVINDLRHAAKEILLSLKGTKTNASRSRKAVATSNNCEKAPGDDDVSGEISAFYNFLQHTQTEGRISLRGEFIMIFSPQANLRAPPAASNVV